VEPDPKDVDPKDVEEDFLGYDPTAVHEFDTQYNNINGPIFTDKEFPANEISVKGKNPGPTEINDYN
jgi:hypothetical protein